MLEPTKQRVLDRLAALQGRIENVGPVLEPITGLPDVYNTSRLTLRGILADPAQVAGNDPAFRAVVMDHYLGQVFSAARAGTPAEVAAS